MGRDGIVFMTIASERMTVATARTHGGPAPSLALRYALRELRGGLRGFYVFIACIALGVMAIAGVGSVAASLSDGLGRARAARCSAATRRFR
jgi:putative ABC transport system permease protein